jgi:LAGLIDADG endonuclease
LLTQKAADFKLFIQIIELILNKEHLTLEGLQKIINIRASMNFGLSDLQKAEFSNFKSVERQIFNTKNIPDPNWIADFVCGEGSFEVIIKNSKSNKIGHQVRLRFSIAQHERDINLMFLIWNYLGSGKIYKDPEEHLFI